MTTTVDLDAAKDRLVDSLSSAREVTKAAVRDEIAPAVAAAVGAAREASGPAYAEAASRASDAVSALRGSEVVARATDAATTLRNSDAAKKFGRKKRSRSKRVPVAVAIIGGGAAAFSVLKRRNAAPAPSYQPPPSYSPRPAAEDSRSTDPAVPTEAPAGAAVQPPTTAT
jgi:hypothetical protein